MKVSVIRTQELDDGLLGAWHRFLADGSLPDSGFLTPEFTIAVGHHRPDARVAVIEDAGRPIGFFPYQSRPGGFARAIGFGINDYQGCVSDPQYSIDLIGILQRCGLLRCRFDHLLQTGTGLGIDNLRSETSPIIDFQSGFVRYCAEQANTSAGFKRAQRKHRRFSESHADSWTFRWHSSNASSLARLLELKSAQCRASGSHDYTAHRWIRGLLEELAGLQETSLTGVLSELRVHDELIALHFGLRTRTRLHWWFPAYDPQWSQWTPGLSLLLETIKTASEHGLKHLDLGKDLSRYKQEFMNTAIEVSEGYAHASVWGRRALRVGETLRRADEGGGHFSLAARPLAGIARRTSRWLRYA